MNAQYRAQVTLLVRTIPYLARQACFALKGGTAINLFHRDMPRLSVDIDLVYLGFEPRDEALGLIQAALARLAGDLGKAGLTSRLQGPEGNQKLIVSTAGASIKIEPNYTLRGHLWPSVAMAVSPRVEEQFGFAEMPVIANAELFGGKLCAALDRQHPRDLFDVSLLLAEPEKLPEVWAGFVVQLLSHNRPPIDLLRPHRKDQAMVFAQEFQGMTELPFAYADHQATLEGLIALVQSHLRPFKDFMIDFFSLNPAHCTAIPADFDRLPAIQWKRQNLETLRRQNPDKFAEQRRVLESYFTSNEALP